MCDLFHHLFSFTNKVPFIVLRTTINQPNRLLARGASKNRSHTCVVMVMVMVMVRVMCDLLHFWRVSHVRRLCGLVKDEVFHVGQSLLLVPVHEN